MGPLPRVSQQEGIAAIARKGNPSAIVAADFFTEAAEARRLFAELVNADAARVALIPAAS